MSKTKFLTNLLFAILLLTYSSGCTGIGAAVVGSTLGLAGTRGLEYYDTGETSNILYTDPNTIEKAVVHSFNKFKFVLESKYLLSDGIIGYTGHNNDPLPDEQVEIEIELEPLSTDITEITITAREDIIMPEEAICHILMNEIMQYTDQQGKQ